MGLTSQAVKETALRAGADLCGIGSMDRFEGAPKEMDPRYLFPEARTVVGMVFRIPRGSRRGIEEGSAYYQYTTSVETLEEVVMPMALLRACGMLEAAGYEALPQRRNQFIMAEKDSTNPEVDYTEVYRVRNVIDPEEKFWYCELRVPFAWLQVSKSKCRYAFARYDYTDFGDRPEISTYPYFPETVHTPDLWIDFQ